VRLGARHLKASMVLAVGVVVVGAGLANASNDALFGQQWSLQQISAPQAWATSRGAGVTIGIVDTGVAANHPDLAGKVVGFANCIGGTCAAGSASDDNGHGTHVSGIAAANTDNGIGIAGVAPAAHLVVAKALDANGSGNTNDINAGIRWVISQGARVVSLSLGPDVLGSLLPFGSGLADGIEYAWSAGAIPVLAAGNSNLLGLGLLGGSDYRSLDAIVVGATDRSGGLASYSSPIDAKYGVVAPGGAGTGGAAADVLSTVPPDGYATKAGTSMATPHVAGAAAALLAMGLSRDAAVHRILASADKVSCGAGCSGRLNLLAAVNGVGGDGPLVPSAPPVLPFNLGFLNPVLNPASTSGPLAPVVDVYGVLRWPTQLVRPLLS
jgi:subtilisin family serine protease